MPTYTIEVTAEELALLRQALDAAHIGGQVKDLPAIEQTIALVKALQQKLAEADQA